MSRPSPSLDVLHVDNHLLVVAKPSGLPTVPDSSGDESLLDRGKAWVAREFSKPGAVFLGVVHRLDRPVSGVVCFARTSKAASRLQPSFVERRVSKVYLAVAGSAPRNGSGRVEHWLLKDPARNTVRVVEPETADARLAVTEWRVLEQLSGRCLLELRPETGRSHQLRVALASLGQPLLGDLRYGAREPLPDRSVALHAAALELEHPVRREPMRFEAPAPTTAVWDFEHLRR